MENTEEIVELGLAFLEKDDYENAFNTLLPCAKKGNAEAQANVGLMYHLGLGVQRDIAEAVTWLAAAADQGIGKAAHNLGTLYLTCEPDMENDGEKSKEWFQKAEELGFRPGTDDWYSEKK